MVDIKMSPKLPTGETIVLEEENGYLYVAIQAALGGQRTRLPERCAITSWTAESMLWEAYYTRGGSAPAARQSP